MPAPLGGIEWDELGKLAGRDAVHLRCRIGGDAVVLARAGARVTGLDFSGASVEAPRDLAAGRGLEIDYGGAEPWVLHGHLHGGRSKACRTPNERPHGLGEVVKAVIGAGPRIGAPGAPSVSSLRATLPLQGSGCRVSRIRPVPASVTIRTNVHDPERGRIAACVC